MVEMLVLLDELLLELELLLPSQQRHPMVR
jgi:hypothetical protein